MKTKEEIILTQIALLKEIADILNNRANLIEDFEKTLTTESEYEKEKRAVIAVFKIRSLKLCKDTIVYLSDELLKNNYSTDFFLLPHVRTLVDVYSRFLCLKEKNDEDQQALVCIAYQLNSYKNLDDSNYKKILGLYSNFLNKIKFNFPEKLSDFTNSFMDKRKIKFEKTRNILTIEKINSCSINAKKTFKQDNPYTIYSHISEFMHGNPYYYNDSPHNEKFWILAISISMMTFFIEIIDIYTLRKNNSRDLLNLLSKIKENRVDFVNLWKNQKILNN